MIKEIELVLHRAFGGFSLDQEMADWLIQHKGWIVKTYKEWAADVPCQLITDGFSHPHFYPPENRNELEFRSNPDLIECVKTLQKLYVDQSVNERKNHQVCRLEIVKYQITIEVEDYNDGYERVVSYGYET